MTPIPLVTDVTAQFSQPGPPHEQPPRPPSHSRIKKVFPASHSNNEFPPFAAFLFAFLPASVVYVSVRFDHGTVRYGRLLSAVFPSHSASEALYITRWGSRQDSLFFPALCTCTHTHTPFLLHTFQPLPVFSSAYPKANSRTTWIVWVNTDSEPGNLFPHSWIATA
jgi:hypothetical protein